MKFYLIVFLVAYGFRSSNASSWSYGDYSAWPGICQTGQSQSPIDLVPKQTKAMVYSAFSFRDYEKSYTGKVKNNGHSIAITLEKSANATPVILGGGLIGEYVLDHIHFHWLSEHTVNGYRYPLEMHLVHYSTKFNSLTDAAKEQGVAVLGVFFEISLDDDEDFIPLIEVMEKVEKPQSQEVVLERKISPKSFLPRHTSDYYRYQGSLTTPECNEGVTWTVFVKPLPLSADQYTHFESIYSDEGPLTLNFRPVQPLNGRSVSLRHSPVPKTLDNGTTNVQYNMILMLSLSLLATIFKYLC